VIAPAGWPLRHFEINDLMDLLIPYGSPIVEISKDFIRDAVPLKALDRALGRLRGEADLAFAGTTDLITCAGLPWERYRRYAGVQIAQARFLECSLFRLFVGDRSPGVSAAEVIRRVRDFCADLAPMTACVEIHAGIESDPYVLIELLRRTPVKIVVDIERLAPAGFTVGTLLEIVPVERVAYFHQRNLPGTWCEHSESLEAEARLHGHFPEGVFLWEPKTVEEPRRVQELYREYRTSH
jgi:hypothetical protein